MSNYLVKDMALSYEAARIRAKTGSAAQITFDGDKGFGDAIDAIPSGGDDPNTITIKGVYEVSLYHEAGMPVKYKIDSPNLKALGFGGNSNNKYSPDHNIGIEELEVAANSQTAGLTVTARLEDRSVYNLKKVNFNNIPIESFYQAFQVVYGSAYIPFFESALGLNFSLCGGANYRIGGGTFQGCAALKNVTLKPNCLGQLDLKGLSYNWLSFSDSRLLTDESLVSIANGLCATYTSKVQLHATPKARLSTIFGTVSQVTDDSGTYDFFTQDPSGTVTLMDFITNMKGWAVA